MNWHPPIPAQVSDGAGTTWQVHRAWPDSLAGGGAMAQLQGPMLLVDPTTGLTPQERAWASDSIYGSMKAALRRLVMSQARELAPHRIRVNAIAPGFIDTRLFVGERGERYDSFNVRAETEILLGPGKPSDIAGAAVYLASDDARYVTGTCLLVDGGMLLPPITEI